MIEQQKQALAALISAALSDLGINDVPVQLSRPKVAEHGDLACNVAMQCAKRLGKAPRSIAEDLVAAMRRRPECSQMLSDIQIAGPGFINLRFNNSAKFGVVAEVLRQGRGYGCNDSCKGQSVLLEYVSANPTGPLHLGHARQGALGDVLARVMRTQGYAVTREFYYNDAGVQIHNLAVSVQARAREELGLANAEEFPENGYRGDYIYDIARDYLAKKPVHTVTGSVVESHADANDLDAIRKYAVAYLRNEQDADMKALDVTMDNFYLESSLYTDGRVEAAVRAMTEAGCTYESDGALWLRTTDPRFAEFKDDKDRVMRKKDGYYTYFVPDVAYHLSKFERGFTRAIDIQGSDHHGTTARVRIGLQAAGTQMGFQIPKTFPEYLLHKMIRVMRDGEEVKMSKRTGTYVTLRDLVDWVGRDAARFFLVSRKSDAEFVFDVDLALAKSDENPVYYLQYAHARICSVLAQAKEKGYGVPTPEQAASLDLASLESEHAAALANKMAEYGNILTVASRDLAPHLICVYLKELAAAFHAFYNSDRVLTDDETVRNARLALLLAARQVLANGLSVLGVSAPERM